MSRVIKAMEAAYNPAAECVEETCNFATDPGSQSLGMAKSHVKRTGHHVRVIKETVALYRLDES